MKLRYVGVHPKARFDGIEFVRGKEVEVPDSFTTNLPDDIEVNVGSGWEAKAIPAWADWTDELIKIKGIGEETAKDIEKIYKTKDELLKALREDRVPLRNDKVALLKKHFKKEVE